MTLAQRIIASVKADTGRTITEEAIAEVFEHGATPSHPVQQAIARAIEEDC